MEHKGHINGTTEPSVNTIGSVVGNSSTPHTDVDESELVTPDSKKRKLTSKVWHHFVKFTDDSGNVMAKCNYCKFTNVFFPDICHIHLKLREWETSNDECLRLMVGPMKTKILKYWEDNTSCLAIAVIFDPRFKMDIVEYYYDLIFGIDSIIHTQKVRMAFFDIYIDYGGRIVFENSDFAPPQPHNGKYSGFKRWKMMSRSDGSRLIPKSKFDQYLEEETHPTVDNFDILTWWSLNAVRFPTLARIARDVLAVPATTIASEAAFSIGGRVLDDARSCLLPEAVEALIATADWIPSFKKLTIDDAPHEVEVE